MRYLLLAQLLLFSSVAFGVDKTASCELASQDIEGRSSSGLAQVSNLGEILITCRVPARPFLTTPGESRNGLKAATTTYEISPDGGKKLVPSEVHQSGGGFELDPGIKNGSISMFIFRSSRPKAMRRLAGISPS